MTPESVRSHWEAWATLYGADLRATTKTATIKKLEIDAFARALRELGDGRGRLLEVGCGNGINSLSLARIFPGLDVTGVDYVPEMIGGAEARLSADPELAARARFYVGDALELDRHPALSAGYDFVLSDRMVINLDTWERQARTLDQLSAKLAPGGHLLLIENFTGAHARQNALRQAVGLPARPVAGYNRFLDEDLLEAQLGRGLRLVRREAFAALHDLVLYVLSPLGNAGVVDYEDPRVAAATELTLACQGTLVQGEGGQNILYVYRRDP